MPLRALRSLEDTQCAHRSYGAQDDGRRATHGADLVNILSRQDAIAQKSSRYFTGQPCKHGHISERYTKSLNCIECLHPSFEPEDIRLRKAARDAERIAVRNAREQITSTRSKLHQIRIRLHKNDLDLFEAMALAAAMSHEPAIRLKEIRCRFVPKMIGIDWHIYAFMCFPEDESTLRGYQDSLEAIRRPHATPLTQQERINAALALADAEADPMPEFRP